MTSTYLEPARGKNNQIWRYIVTILAMIWAMVGVSLILVVIVFAVERTTDYTKLSPMATLLLGLLPFPVMLLALWAGLKFIHKRSLKSLLRPVGTFSWRKVWLSALLWFGLAGASDVFVWWMNPDNYRWSFDAGAFFSFLPLILILIPIQTSTEEFIFRGYLTQWAGRYSRSLWLPWILPSLVFMSAHGLNPEVQTYGALLTLPLYLAIGLLLSWITLKSGGLEMALGLHTANNLYASLIVTFPSTALSTPALFSIQQYDPVIGLVQQLAVTGIYLLILYQWKKPWLREGEPAPAAPPLPETGD